MFDGLRVFGTSEIRKSNWIGVHRTMIIFSSKELQNGAPLNFFNIFDPFSSRTCTSNPVGFFEFERSSDHLKKRTSLRAKNGNVDKNMPNFVYLYVKLIKREKMLSL